jgi:hypothetical protein
MGGLIGTGLVNGYLEQGTGRSEMGRFNARKKPERVLKDLHFNGP